LCGNSFSIGEQTLKFIPGFKSVTVNAASPNWAMATVNFDTTGRGNTNNVFWVVVWMDGPGGKPGTEMPAHGLTAVPSLNALQQITDVAVENYSNNVGMYGVNSPFLIAPPQNPGGAHTADGRIDGITLSPPRKIMLGERVKVTAEFHGTGGEIASARVAYFDGNPRKKGKLLDLQEIPHMAQNSSYQHRIFFAPQSCGTHVLYAEVIGRGMPPSVGGGFRTDVNINAMQELDGLLDKTRAANLPPGYAQTMPFLVEEARRLLKRRDRHFALLALKAYLLLANDLYARAQYQSKVEALVSGVNFIAGCERALGASPRSE
jgi:hypothetical protein